MVVSILLSFANIAFVIAMIAECNKNSDINLVNGLLSVLILVVATSMFLTLAVYLNSTEIVNPLAMTLYWMARLVTNATAIVLGCVVISHKTLKFKRPERNFALTLLAADCLFVVIEEVRARIRDDVSVGLWLRYLANIAAAVETLMYSILITDITYYYGAEQHTAAIVLLSIGLIALVLRLTGMLNSAQLKPEVAVGAVSVAAFYVMFTGAV